MDEENRRIAGAYKNVAPPTWGGGGDGHRDGATEMETRWGRWGRDGVKSTIMTFTVSIDPNDDSMLPTILDRLLGRDEWRMTVCFHVYQESVL